MFITKEDLLYLKGEKFSDDYTFNVSNQTVRASREEYIAQLVSDRYVIHLGFADHSTNISRKIDNGTWFHNILCHSAEKCIGIDINREAIDYVEKTHGISDVYYGDITKNDIDVIKTEKWDYLILGEVLEHIQNPIEFLEMIKENYGDSIDKIIITVPNAFYYRNFINNLSGIEQVNPDHKYWFTPYTLLKNVVSSGYDAEELVILDNKVEEDRSVKLNFKGRLVQNLLNRVVLNKPLFNQTLVCIAKL